MSTPPTPQLISKLVPLSGYLVNALADTGSENLRVPAGLMIGKRNYPLYSSSNVFTFLKTGVVTTSTNRIKHQKLPTRYLFTKKAAFRDLQKNFVNTKFLRFFNHQVDTFDFFLAQQVVTKYTTTREDN